MNLYYINLIGFYSPKIVFIFSIFLLFVIKYNVKNTIFYILGYYLCDKINFLLKKIIKQPRPFEDINIFNNKKKIYIHNNINMYGMPSGHALYTTYSTIYINNILKNKIITFIYCIITLICINQRLIYKNHTIQQIVVGGILGIFIAYFIIYIQNNFKKWLP